MAAERIDELVSEKAFKQVDDLTQKLSVLNSVFIDDIDAAIKLNAAIGGAKSFKEYAKTIEDTEKKIIQLRTAQTNLEKAELQLQQKRDQMMQKQLANDQKAIASEQKKSRVLTENSRIYTQLSQTLDKLRKDAQDVGVQFGVNSVQFQKASERVRALDERLKEVDRNLGKFNRDVGDYARAGSKGFDRLGFSIQQLGRELPAFAVDVRTGILALSNNIPIFYDEVKRANAEIKELRAQGKQVPGLFNNMLRSILSFGTFLSVAVTLMTIYGKEVGEFFSTLLKGREAMSEFAERQKMIGEAFKDTNYAEAIKNVNELRVNIDLANKGFLNKDKVLKQYNETIGKTIGRADSLNEAEQLMIDKSDDYLRVMFLKAAAQLTLEEAAKKALEAEQARAQGGLVKRPGGGLVRDQSNLTIGERLRSAFAQNEGVTDSLVKAATDRNVKAAEDGATTLLTIAENFQKQAAEIAKKIGLNFFGDDDGKNKTIKDSSELAKVLLQIAKERAEEIYTDETKSLNERLKALDDYTKAAQKLVALDAQAQLREADLTADKRKAIQTRAEADILNIETDNRNKAFDLKKADNERLLKIEEERLKKELEAGKKAGDALVNRISLLAEQRQQMLTESADRELIQLAQRFANGEITEEQYAQRRLEIQRKLTKDLVNEDIKRIQTLISLQKLAGNDTAENEKKLAELRQKLSKDTTDAQIQDLEKLREREQELIGKRKEILQEFSNFAIAIVQGQFQESEYRLQKESEQADIKKAKDIEEVERSIASEQDKAAKIAIINAKAQTQKEALERRQRQLDLERARFEKQAGIGRIIVDTASAVAEALPNIPLSILVGALGAAQLATAVATPLPRFEHGGKMKESGLAEFGHGTELRIDPDGKVSLTPSTPTIGFVQKGTEFKSNKELIRMIAKPDPITSVGGRQINMDKVIESQERTRKEIVGAISASVRRGAGVGYYSTGKGRNYINRNI